MSPLKGTEIVVLSGKGGTGKTFLTASLICLAEYSVLADCDVDAANLHLLLNPQVVVTHPFIGGRAAQISAARCTGCGSCLAYCRFDALALVERSARSDDESKSVAVADPMSCEGCGVCAYVCPIGAVELTADQAGRWFESETEHGPLFHAQLDPGEENSGKLVEIIRRSARQRAETDAAAWTLIDGPPGTGCAAKSALTGVDYAVLVTEPTPAGTHDLERVISLLAFFGIPGGVVVNKSTIHPQTTKRVRELAERRELDWLGEIPFERSVAASVASYTPYPADHDDEVTDSLRGIWTSIQTATHQPAAR